MALRHLGYCACGKYWVRDLANKRDSEADRDFVWESLLVISVMDLLEHPLIKAYFVENHLGHKDGMCDDLVALRIIQAMQQPIKKGERYLMHRQIPDMFGETTFDGEDIYNVAGFHPFALRLPDRFQVTEELKPEPQKCCVACEESVHMNDCPCHKSNDCDQFHCGHGVCNEGRNVKDPADEKKDV